MNSPCEMKILGTFLLSLSFTLVCFCAESSPGDDVTFIECLKDEISSDICRDMIRKKSGSIPLLALLVKNNFDVGKIMFEYEVQEAIKKALRGDKSHLKVLQKVYMKSDGSPYKSDESPPEKSSDENFVDLPSVKPLSDSPDTPPETSLDDSTVPLEKSSENSSCESFKSCSCESYESSSCESSEKPLNTPLDKNDKPPLIFEYEPTAQEDVDLYFNGINGVGDDLQMKLSTYSESLDAVRDYLENHEVENLSTKVKPFENLAYNGLFLALRNNKFKFSAKFNSVPVTLQEEISFIVDEMLRLPPFKALNFMEFFNLKSKCPPPLYYTDSDSTTIDWKSVVAKKKF